SSKIGLQGTINLKPSMGNEPFIKNNSDILGAALEINCAKPDNYNGTGYGDSKIRLSKIFHLSAGAVDLKHSDNLYGSVDGVKLLTGESLNSTPNKVNYLLKRPYE